jgi:hypothetical protein
MCKSAMADRVAGPAKDNDSVWKSACGLRDPKGVTSGGPGTSTQVPATWMYRAGVARPVFAVSGASALVQIVDADGT